MQIKPLQDQSHIETAGNQNGDEDLHFSYLYCLSQMIPEELHKVYRLSVINLM